VKSIDWWWCLFQPASTGDFIGERDKAIFLFLLNTGARARELCNLNIKEIDLNTGSAMIRYGKGGKTRMVFIGRKSGMHIFVLQRLMGHADLQVLRRYLAQNEEDNQLAYMREGLLTTTYEF